MIFHFFPFPSFEGLSLRSYYQLVKKISSAPQEIKQIQQVQQVQCIFVFNCVYLRKTFTTPCSFLDLYDYLYHVYYRFRFKLGTRRLYFPPLGKVVSIIYNEVKQLKFFL